MSKVKGKHIEFNDSGTSTTDVWSADKIISYVGSASNPFDQDLNTTDDVVFNTITLPTTTSSTGILKSGNTRVLHTYGVNNLFLGLTSGNFEMTGTANIGIGYLSLVANTDGSYNVGLGSKTFENNTGGDYNTAIGFQSANKNTTGNYNTFLGAGSGYSNTTGFNNSFFGYASGASNTTGYYNASLGSESLYSITTGINNAAFGASSGYSLTTGNNNVAFGQGSLYSNVSGSGNVAIGPLAGYYETGSNKLYIANSDTNPLIYGDFITKEVILDGSLELTGNIELPTTTSTTGQIKQNGKTIFHTYGTRNYFLGISAGNYLYDRGGNNVAVGFASMQNNNGSKNTMIGEASGQINSTSNSVHIGYHSGQFVGGSENVLIGYRASESNSSTSQSYNVIIGSYAGFSSLTNNNVYLGAYAGFSNSAGSSNVFLGNRAGYYETGSNKLYIANSNTADPLIYGEFDNDFITINGDLNITGKMNIPLRTITNSTDTGTAGEICYDANFIYICVATDTWKRVAIGTW